MSTPHRCPICNGTGEQPMQESANVDHTQTALCPLSCRTCGGGGIVWEPDRDAPYSHATITHPRWSED